MENWFEIVVINSVLATLLALIAALVSRQTPAPPYAYVFWSLVLTKILTPPILELPILPSPGLDITQQIGASGWSMAGVVWLWVLGVLAVSVPACVRIYRFSRLVREAQPADRMLTLCTEELAVNIGLEQCPEVLILDRRVPPLVWAPFSAPRIILPRALLERLEPLELDAILTHELAHIRRLDHQHRMVELMACSLFWWHPAVWWAKRSVQRWREISCDQLVVEKLPGAARAYAEGLLKTLELNAARPAPIPALASGILTPKRWGAGGGALKDIRERLTLIMRPRTERRYPPLVNQLLLAFTLCVCLLTPTFKGNSDQEPATPPEAQQRVNLER